MGLFDRMRRKAAKPVDRIELLRRALATVKYDLPDTDPVTLGRAAGRLAGTMRAYTASDPEDARVVVAGGIFGIKTTLVFDALVGKATDAPSDAHEVAFFVYCKGDKARFKRDWPAVERAFNDMCQAEDELLEILGAALTAWCVDPSESNLQRLPNVFEDIIEQFSVPRLDVGLAAALRASLASIGYSPSNLSDPLIIGMGASHLVKDLLELVQPDRSDSRFEDWCAVYACIASDAFCSILGGNHMGGRVSAIIGLVAEEEAADKTGDTLADRHELVNRFLDGTNRDRASLVKEIDGAIRSWCLTPSKANHVKLAAMLSYTLKGPKRPPLTSVHSS